MNEISHALQRIFREMDDPAIAVSGGVDSMTLAVVAGRDRGGIGVIHAVPPAVPPTATARVRNLARAEGWRLRVIDAGEFADDRYRRNPANRCFFCKTNLYGAMGSLHDGTLASGTNTDDLGDYRPGLAAAADHGVRHPYVEAGIDKAGVRRLAAALGLDDLARLPAAPCLSSRVETGIAITAPALRMVDRVETLIRDALGPRDVRCRIRRDGVVVELDADGLNRIGDPARQPLRTQVAEICRASGFDPQVGYGPYRMGSAFLRPDTP